MSRSPPGDALQHALKVRSAIANGDYPTLFQLYHNAPNLSGFLMDQFIPRERLITFRKLCVAFRPTLTVEFLTKRLGFIPDQSTSSEIKKLQRQCKSFLKKHGVDVKEGGIIDSKVCAGLLLVAVAEMEMKGVDIKGQIH